MKITSMITLACQTCMMGLLLTSTNIGVASPPGAYDGANWTPIIKSNYKEARHVSDSTFAWIFVFGERPIYDYPVGPSTIVGINDTLEIAIVFESAYGEIVSLAGKDSEKWFVPQVFETEADIHKESPQYDSEVLGFGFDGWRLGYQPVDKPDTLDKYGSNELIMRVWGVPEGTWRLVVRTTDKYPKDFANRVFGQPYYYWHAKSLADSLNAWNDLFYRAYTDSNEVLAKQWLDSIQMHNPDSYAGFALAARYHRMKDDSAAIVKAYDDAIHTLKTLSDPAIPDTSSPWDDYAYKRWYEYYLDRMELERDRYMNEPETRSWFDFWR